MTLEQARATVAEKDISTKEKRDLFVEALKILAANAFKKQN